MSETHDPMNLTAAELRTEYSKALAMVHELATARAAEATQHAQEIAAKDEHIAVVEGVLREHSEFGGLFQPGGRFHRVANLRLGGSAVADGGRWLVARLAAVEAERDAERQRWMDARAREIEHSIRADRAEAERDRLKADQQDWRKGVALIASALGDKADDLSCVRIAEIALTLRAALEEAHALLKLFQTCYPAAIASLPENGMERMSAALTLSASPRTERHDEHDQARRCDAD